MEDINNMVEALTTKIIEVAHASIPKYGRPKSRTPVPCSNIHKPSFQPIKQATERRIDFEASEDTIQSYDDPFSIEKLDKALQETQSIAPGPDDIVYDMMKKMHSAEKGKVPQLFNRIWQRADK
ncbi:hypothetical protein JTB14_000505 [Gonioctena quinquepunctata]|nr:hypothetical protein JTB14_000505 [Gonioctena quinquepunctata]